MKALANYHDLTDSIELGHNLGSYNMMLITNLHQIRDIIVSLFERREKISSILRACGPGF